MAAQKKTTSTTAAKARAAGAKAPADRKDETEPKKVTNVRLLEDEVVLDWDDNTYRIERDAIDDVELILDLEQGKQVSAAVRLLGPAQWETFKAATRVGTRVPYSAAEEFLVAVLEQVQKVQNSGN